MILHPTTVPSIAGKSGASNIPTIVTWARAIITQAMKMTIGVSSFPSFVMISTIANSSLNSATKMGILTVSQIALIAGLGMVGATPKTIPKVAAGMVGIAAPLRAKTLRSLVEITGGSVTTPQPVKTPVNVSRRPRATARGTMTLGAMMAGMMMSVSPVG